MVSGKRADERGWGGLFVTSGQPQVLTHRSVSLYIFKHHNPETVLQAFTIQEPYLKQSAFVIFSALIPVDPRHRQTLRHSSFEQLMKESG